jgi:hypothetical protein
LFDFRTSGSESTTRIYSYVTGTTLYIGFGGSDDINVGSVFTASQQNHLAIVRSGSGSNNVSIFLNGSRIYQLTDTTNFSTNTFATIGRRYAISGGDNYWLGYLSNLRALKGTAQYSGTTYTVPTSPLTAITNTQLLTCQSNRFIDNSTNAFTLTVNGSPSVQRFSPFSPTSAYSTTVNGGSAFFDGTGDYLSAADNSAFNLNSVSFTVECWVYWNSVSGEQNIVEQFTNPSGPGWTLYKFNSSTGSPAGSVDFYGGSTGLNSGLVPVAGQWYHLAISRDNSTGAASFYVNGTRTANATFNVSSSASTALLVGVRAGGSTWFNGYMEDLRIVKGSYVYNPTATSITVPTAPLTAVSGTSLLLNYTNAGVLDNAMMNDLETVGNAQISTSVKKYGTGSLAFDGGGDYIVPTSPSSNVVLGLGSGDFTIEFWVYFNSGLGSDIVLFDGRPLSTNGAYPTLYVNSSSQISYVVSSADRITSASAFSTSTWYHIAVSRSGTSTKMFVNGTQVGSTYTDSTNYLSASRRPVIGINGFNETAAPLNGYIDDLRITKGVARYTANFSVPTAAFPNN